MIVPDDLSHAHETVRAVANALRIKNRDGHRLVLGHRSWFAVTRDVRMRALRILDGLTRAMVERGHGVVFERRTEDDEPTTAFEFIVSGERVEVFLEERISRRPHVLTPAQERRVAKGDPSQKARILAEGISEAMNCTALSLAVWVPSAVAALVITRKRKGAGRRA